MTMDAQLAAVVGFLMLVGLLVASLTWRDRDDN